MWRIIVFLHRTLKPHANPCTEDLPNQGKKNADEQIEIQSHDDRTFRHLSNYSYWLGAEGQTVYYKGDCVSNILQRSFDHPTWSCANKNAWCVEKSSIVPPPRQYTVNQDFLVKHGIPVFEHPPYSPDLNPCYIFWFPKIKSALKGTRFESTHAVKKKGDEDNEGHFRRPTTLLPTMKNLYGVV